MKKKIDSASIIAMAGITLALISLVIIFSQNTAFEFLTLVIVRPFGFIGFWIFLPFIFILGLYMLLKQKLVRFKIGLSLWGFFIIIFTLLILASTWAEQSLVPGGELNFGNISSVYIPALLTKEVSTPYQTESGGGIVGYFLAGCLYSSVTKIGTTIICWVLIFVGLCLVFNLQIKKLFNLIRNHKSNPKKSKKVSEEEVYQDIAFEEYKENEVVTPVQPQVNVAPQSPLFDPDLEMRNYNNTHGLKRATFSLEDNDDNFMQAASFGDNPNSFSSPSFNEEVDSKPQFDEYSGYVNEDELPENFDALASFNDEREESVEPTQEVIQPQTIKATPIQEPIQEEVKPEPVVDKLHRPQPKANLIKNYIYPGLDLLDYHEDSNDAEKNAQSTQETIDRINEVFEQLHIGARVVGSTVGPAVTRYDVQTNTDVSVKNVERYIEDISIRLGGVSTRFEKIVYGKATSGLEIPNAVRTNVGLRESIEKLPSGPKCLRYIPFGKNISGELLSANLSDFPHMLVSGTTGSGKTIFMHSVILSLIMRNRPDELKIVLIDPKKVEMAYYEQIPHLLCPNISQSSKAFVAMKKLVDEMERRYNLFAANRVRDIKGFNEFALANDIQPLPYIVVFIDEYADLVEEVKDIKIPVVRIAQKARAAGIHLVIATQRPSVNVIDGVIKANVSTRVALMVASQVDSISIINQAGAEQLLGNGDMIVDCALISKSIKPRVQGCFVDVPEINRVCDFLRKHYKEQYDPEFLDLEEHDDTSAYEDGGEVPQIDKDMAEEQLYEMIKEQIVERDYCSISYIQRTYGVGFPKAGRLFNKLINDGYVARGGDARGSKVLIRQKNEQQMGTIEQSTFIPDNEED